MKNDMLEKYRLLKDEITKAHKEGDFSSKVLDNVIESTNLLIEILNQQESV
ncbi:hypothetical protein [Dethiothermospora halolimnae]|uniref:hypothetical protein n=1 Tax=Dethiothermospora halolimnae TaxID=3114390 RepID=UPI003CCBF837